MSMARELAVDAGTAPAGRQVARQHARHDGAIAREGWHITVHDDIAPLADAWRRLEATGNCTVFQSHDWLATWYEVAARHGLAEPLIVVATRPGATVPDVIVPLCRLRRRGHVEAAFPDIMVSDFAGPLFAPDALRTPAEMRELWRAIRRSLPGCDTIHLTKIAAQVGGRENPLLGLRGIARFPCGVWGLPLEPGSGTAPALVPEAMRASVDKRRAALGRKGRVVTWTEDAALLPQMFDELVALRTTRSERIGRDEILHLEPWRDFYATLVARRHEGLRVVMARIEVGGATIATMLGLGYGGAMHYLLPTFVMKKWSRHTPGFQLIIDAMEMSAARGYRYFDFTIGDEPYKAAFGGQYAPLHEIMAPLTLRGLAPYAIWRLKLVLRRYPRLGNRLRRLLGREPVAIAAVADAAAEAD